MNGKKHYYGDLVRKLFLAAALLMIILLPFMTQYLEVPLYISILAAIALSVFAGITNPLQRWSVILDFLVALLGTVIFEYQAVQGYTTYSLTHRTFWGNQALAVLFIVALYFCTKTVRGMFLK